MIPRVAPPSPADVAETSRRVPVQPRVPIEAQGAKTPATDPADKFQPVRVGPLFEMATSDQNETVAQSDQRIESKAYSEKLMDNRDAEQRSLQQKLYNQF